MYSTIHGTSNTIHYVFLLLLDINTIIYVSIATRENLPHPRILFFRISFPQKKLCAIKTSFLSSFMRFKLKLYLLATELLKLKETEKQKPRVNIT
jgi:hypothetical protein